MQRRIFPFPEICAFFTAVNMNNGSTYKSNGGWGYE